MHATTSGWQRWLRGTAVVAGLAAGVLALTLPPAMRGQPPPPFVPGVSSVEIGLLRDANAAGADLAARGEAAVADRALPAAAALYAQAGQLVPRHGFVHRRHCQLLSALGQRDEAKLACQKALEYGASVRDLRAAVRVLMSSPAAPTVDDVADAHMMAIGARRMTPAQPYGHAALADIATRIGDRELLRAALAALTRVAPDHDETAHVQAHALPTPLGRVVGWTLLALLAAGAAAPIIARWRRRMRGLVVHAAVAIAAATAVLGAPAQAADRPTDIDGFSRFTIDDADPVGTLPSAAAAAADPMQFGYLLMDIAGKAEDAAARGEHRTALRYYQALAKAAPNRSVAFAKMCKAHEALGEIGQALDACRQALAREGATVEDSQRFARLRLAGAGPLDAAARADVLAVVTHLRADAGTRAAGDEIACQLATRGEDTALLASCVERLRVVAPGDAKTVSYEWSLALARGDHGEAARLVQRARRAGVKPAGIARMQAATDAVARRQRLPIYGGAALAILAAGIVLFVVRRARPAPALQGS